MDFLLADAPYTALRNRKDAHAGYKVFHSNDMKDMVRVSEDVMTPWAHEHVFCSALQFSLRYTAIVLKQKERKTAPKDFGVGVWES